MDDDTLSFVACQLEAPPDKAKSSVPEASGSPRFGELRGPMVTIDSVPYPLTENGRHHSELRSRLVELIPDSHSIEFEMEGCLDLPETQFRAVIASLTGMMERRHDIQVKLMDAMLQLDPGDDVIHGAAWEFGAISVAVKLVHSDYSAGQYARTIVGRAKQLGLKKITIARVKAQLLDGARKVYGEQLNRPRGTPLPAQVAGAGPAVNYHDPLQYLMGEFPEHLWHDGAGNGYITIGSRNLRIGSAEFGNWVRDTWFAAHAAAIKDDQFRACVSTLCAAASAKRHTVAKRITKHEGTIYIDMANDDYEVVIIGPEGWAIINGPSPVKFVRSANMGALPRPERGGSIADLREFVNLSDQDFRSFVGSLLDALKGGGEYLVTALHGEQGSAKSTLTRVGVRLIDPRRLNGDSDLSDVCAMPTREDDLAVIASNHHLLAFDNVSRISDEMSDSLCRVSTGGSLLKRKLYTDGDQVRLSYCGPVLLNGITDIVTRGDLASRSVILRALKIDRVTSSDEFWSRFQKVRPKILGALYDAVAAGLKEEVAGPLPAMCNLTRMARSAGWIHRCYAHLGWSYADWHRSVNESQADVEIAALHADEVGKAVLTMWQTLSHASTHMDTPSHWHRRLLSLCPQERKRYFPAANKLKGALTRLAPALRRTGIEVTIPSGDEKVMFDGKRQRVWTFRACDASDAIIVERDDMYAI